MLDIYNLCVWCVCEIYALNNLLCLAIRVGVGSIVQTVSLQIITQCYLGFLPWRNFGFFMSVSDYFGLVICWFWLALTTSMA